MLCHTSDISTQPRLPSKVRGAELPQEYDLARFIGHTQNTDPSWTTSTLACNWRDVECDDGMHVTDLNWKRPGEIAGTLQWNCPTPHITQVLHMVQPFDRKGGA